jgi:hypothetical protein
MSSPAYLDQWPLAELPAEQRPLLDLALSFMEAAIAIECIHQPGPPLTTAAETVSTLR